MLNPYISAEQERIRTLVGAMYSAEYPLRSEDLKLLNPFVKQVREEIVETTEPGRRGITRTGYFMLNDRGRSLYRQWLGGGLDHLVAKQARQQLA